MLTNRTRPVLYVILIIYILCSIAYCGMNKKTENNLIM